jgi:hypothetical protein
MSYQKFNTASNLVFISTGIGILNGLRNPELFENRISIIVAGIIVFFMLMIGVLIRMKYEWMKYVLLCLFILGLIGLPKLISDLIGNPINGIIMLVKSVIQLAVVIILFRSEKTERG